MKIDFACGSGKYGYLCRSVTNSPDGRIEMGVKMKEYYTISEISRLYGIGVDSLRYYERIGALSPRRGENNYRLYSLKDIYRLNIIRDLLTLGFSVKQIGEYLGRQNVESTLSMLEEEKEKIRQQRERLKQMERAIGERMEHLEKFRTVEAGRFACVSCPERCCLQLNAEIRRDEEMDYAVKRLQKRHEDKIRSLGEREIGASVSVQDVENGIDNLFHSVFIILEEGPGKKENPGKEAGRQLSGGKTSGGKPDDGRNDDERSDGLLILPAGEYLTVYYRGGYQQSPERIRELLAEAGRRRLAVEGDVLEWYPVDNRYTVDAGEFVTRLQVKVRPER